MIAVVTGGSGFIGRNLVRRLLDDGHTVRCLTRPRGGTPPNGASRWPVRYDDPRSLGGCGAFDGAEVVFHLAGETVGAGQAVFDAANVQPTRNLLHVLAEARSRCRFVYVSSQAAAGPAPSLDSPVTERDEPRPVEAYGRSKLAAERVVAGFADRLACTIVRPCAVFGPGDRAFLTMFRLARLGLVLYPGNERHWITVLHVDDVTDGLVRAAGSTAAVGGTFFLGSERATPWRALGEHIAAAVGKQAAHWNVPWPLLWSGCAAGEVIAYATGLAGILNLSKAELARHPYWVCSTSRAREVFAFRPSRSLPDALRETYLWYSRNGWLPAS